MRLVRCITASLAMNVLSCVPVGELPPRISFPSPVEIDVNVYVSNSFSDDERVSIVSGINMWERATRGLIRAQLIPFNGVNAAVPESEALHRYAVVFWRTTSDNEWVKAWDAEHKNLLYGYCHGQNVWMVENRLTDRSVRTIIAAHEFGHAIGLDHVDDESSVMSRFYRRSTACLSVHDLRAFCDRYVCPIDDEVMPTCSGEVTPEQLVGPALGYHGATAH